MRNLVSLALFLLALPLAAQRIDSVAHELPVEAMPPATLDELARQVVAQPLDGRHDERPRRAHRFAAKSTAPAIVPELVTAPAAVAVPFIARGFRSSFDPLPAATAYFYPPDASGAVGPHHVVGAFNNSLSVQDRDGNQLAFLSIFQFWANGGLQLGNFIFDPRVMYDATNDRWVLAMLTDVDEIKGALLLAISATGDPAGVWRRYRVNISSDPNVALDFTRMAITADQIVITADEYVNVEALNGTDIFTITKSSAYSATQTPAVVKTQPSFYDDLTPVSSSDNTVRILSEDEIDVLQFELAGGQLQHTNNYRKPSSVFFDSSSCDQLGSDKAIDCGQSMLQYALLRDGALWIVQKAVSSRSAIVVWKIAGGSARTTILSEPGVDYAYPSIAVNKLGAALVGYSTMNANMYASAACRYIDPNGNVSVPAAVKGGEDWWGNFRWGDYSTTLVDPLDDT
ncbi:MAG TPA: hypothetical protein VJZ76_13820, partial [Thermoanaerobaculia bacterium]|nr:hypothetical protein [Thermoanaerobaculia bacterium]